MPDVYRGLWGGKYCRDSCVQSTRECDCSSHHCQATEHYYKQLEEVFKHSIPCGHVAALMVESIQVVIYYRFDNVVDLFAGKMINNVIIFSTGCWWHCSIS